MCNKNMIMLVILIGMTVALAACQPAPIMPTPEPTPTYTATPYPYEQCAWMWAYNDAPEIATQWRAALAALNLPVIETETGAFYFGENCMGQDSQVIRFAGMETDFTVALTVVDASDIGERAKLVEPILRLLLASFPDLHPSMGYIDFHFVSATETQYLRILIRNAAAAFEAGKTGIDFYNAVGAQP